ncbi:MAG: hypothetical protein JWM78_925 [Verrucomicrobiaceae bacterium]|nr:hypothetical protein [Verrucomicrobiaceae bacterium]
MADINNHRGRAADDSVRELDFDDDDIPPPRIGDPRLAKGEIDTEISARRVREAGFTGGETTHDITADDLSPETLLDEDYQLANPADKKLRVVDADEIGGGNGKDEAELANEQNAPE